MAQRIWFMLIIFAAVGVCVIAAGMDDPLQEVEDNRLAKNESEDVVSTLIAKQRR